ncbi:translation initiation factor 2, alpha subunit [Cenarchaeum symbiosum A]|uniref:Translation initiation factor 2 subunit alpha n=1 Tax=Cenarchaeum symbiosum (strain A) TaxID=414004 RepID=A0RYY9_CENSY|nr:translation initiation factor 2, alpha subunit [Cenarchaeum symbiosum A]
MQELPEPGEVVLATVTRVMDHGAYVSLDEFGDIPGFLHISEIAPGWIRSISRFVKTGEKKVLLVKRVNEKRADIDLSLKQVSIDQKKRKLLEVKRYEKGRTLLGSVADKAGLSDGDVDELEEALCSKFDSAYDAFSQIARGGISLVSALKLPKKTLSAMEEVSSKIRLPSVEIRGIMEITNSRPDGVEVIRDTLSAAAEGNVKITYLGAPTYRISITAPDFKTAEKELKPLVEGIQRSAEKNRGTFKFTREESKKTREE